MSEGTSEARSRDDEKRAQPRNRFCIALLALLCGQAAVAKDLPNVVILATGGTIAGAAASGTQAGYTSGAVTIDAMIAAVPGIRDLANIKGEQISNVGSQDMSFDILLAGRQAHATSCWRSRRRRHRHHARHRHHGGVGLLPQPDGQERQAGGAGRLDAAVDRGVRGRSAQPLQRGGRGGRSERQGPRRPGGDERLDPRRPLADQDEHDRGADLPVAGRAAWSGVATYGKNDFYGVPPWKHTAQSEFDITNVTKLPRVDIIFAYLDMGPELIDASAASGAKGMVIAGVGNGNMNKAAVEAAARAVKKGVVVVRCEPGRHRLGRPQRRDQRRRAGIHRLRRAESAEVADPAHPGAARAPPGGGAAEAVQHLLAGFPAPAREDLRAGAGPFRGPDDLDRARPAAGLHPRRRAPGRHRPRHGRGHRAVRLRVRLRPAAGRAAGRGHRHDPRRDHRARHDAGRGRARLPGVGGRLGAAQEAAVHHLRRAARHLPADLRLGHDPRHLRPAAGDRRGLAQGRHPARAPALDQRRRRPARRRRLADLGGHRGGGRPARRPGHLAAGRSWR